jgi:glycerol-3-phosphate acyltransferase PlsY
MTVNMSSSHALLALIPAAYLAGSIPFGLIVGLSKGVDVRKAGSGNIGATNVGRLLGRPFFFLVFFLDLLKGLVPMLLAAAVLRRSPANSSLYILCLLVGFAAIFGHMFSLFLNFKGGKGVATSTGVVLGLWPFYTLPAIVAVAVFLIVLYLTRYVSVASMIGSISLPIAYLIIGLASGWDPLGRQLPLLVFAVLISALIIYKHRGNLARLRAGTENRLRSRVEKMNEP